MITYSDQLNCYVEGVKIPILSCELATKRNAFVTAHINLPLGDIVVPKMWANALIQVTYIANINGTRMEKLLFQGLCDSLLVHEEKSLIEVFGSSVWRSLNSNTTLDYTSPKRYGLQRLEDGILMHVGTENDVIIEGVTQNNYQISRRYFWVDAEKDIEFLDPDSADALKLEFILQRTPYAERYAYSLFEDIAYQNFLLTRTYVDRFNLLSKSGTRTSREREDVKFLYNMRWKQVLRDPGRQNILKDMSYDKNAYRNDEQEEIPLTESKVNHSGFGNFRDIESKDSRNKFIGFRGSSPKEEQYCTPQTAEALLKSGQEIYQKYGVTLVVGDISKANNAGTDFIGTKWGPHQDHRYGKSADLYIQGASNCLATDYDYKRAIGCFKIFISNGARRILFGDTKNLTEIDNQTNNLVHYASGHASHFHVDF